MTSKSYRWCSVPVCTNTSIKTPEKLFIFVPFDKKLRKKWLQLARRDLKGMLPTSQFYFCEDHFDLPNDMANYMEYHVMGSVSQIRMKPGCVPSKFECQPDRRKRTSYANERRCIAKKQRREVIEEIEQKLQNKKTTTVTTEQLELEDPSPGTSGLQESTTKDAPKMLQNDMVNYMQYHVMGTVSKVRMKPDCVPTKFSWQSDAKTQLSGKDRSHIFGKGKKMIVEKCDEEPSSEETESCYTDSEMSANEDNPSGRTGVIHIIDKFKVKSVNQIYKSILIYQDQDTGFCFLRPLMKKCQVEIVAELHKIFLNYVPARNVDVHSCTKDMVDSIQDQMDLLCPKLKITFTKRNTGSNVLAMQIASKLSAWMSKTNRDEWELGCCVVQRDINTEGEPGNTPHCKLWRGLQAHRQTDRADTQASEVADTQTSEPEYFVKQEMDIGPETIEGLPCLKVDASQVEIKVERDDDDDTYS